MSGIWGHFSTSPGATAALMPLRLWVLQWRWVLNQLFAMRLTWAIPVIVDACGAGNEDITNDRASLEFAGDAVMTDVETICSVFHGCVAKTI